MTAQTAPSATAAAERELDLVLVGATGFVGRLTARHLAAHAPTGIRIALAGRSAERLDRLRAELDPVAQGWPLISVDVTDTDAVRALAQRTRVVASAVGPYLRYGLPLVQACADAGTHYADLTGETLFVRRSIETCHDRARQTGARIVHSCGFDSVPSDLGVGLTAARAAVEGQGSLGETVLRVRSMRGGISGGTFDSLRQQVLEVSAHPELRRLLGDPMALVGAEPTPVGGVAREHRSRPIRKDHRGRWETPFVMGGFNRQIVRRSDALSGWSYGADFQYREVVDTGSGAPGAARAALLLAGAGALAGGVAWPLTRRALDTVLPKPGEGPSERTLQRGRFLFEIEAGTTGGARYLTRFSAEQDFGYGGTAVMFGESALSLADDDLPERGGVLTPMAMMGHPLADRLRARGFDVDTHPIEGRP